jgi:eukaryotic-like serine/threonine-protein kinase
MRGFADHGRLPAMNSDWRPDDAGADRVLGGRYRLISQVGTGGMAVVWQAYDEVLARTVAVKVLAAHYADAPQARDRIRREAQAAAALSHPNIAQVYDYGEAEIAGEVIPYVVMELIRGGTLHQRMDEGPVLPRYAMRLCAEIGAALAAAHAEGLVHRDIKPANIMLAPTGAKVVDFGIAAAIRPPGSAGDPFEVLGTPAYLAPERLLHDAVEPASDVYALGVLLYRLLAGHSPWTSETTTQMLTAHIYLEPAPLMPMFQVPDYVTALCNRCLAKDPADRPSAREAAALLTHGAGLQVITDEPPVREQPATDTEPSVLIRAAAAPAPAAASADPAAFSSGPAVGAPRPSHPEAAGAAVAQPDDPARHPEQQPGQGDVSPPDVWPPPATPVDGDAPPDPGGEEPSSPSGRKRVLALAAVVLVAAIAATLWFVFPGHRDQTAWAPGLGPGPAASGAAANPLPGASTTPTLVASDGPRPGRTGAVRTGGTLPTGGPAAPADRIPTRPTSPAPIVPTDGPDPVVTTPAPEYEPTERTLSSAAGSVRATCPSPETAQLLSWSATKPYKVTDGDTEAGPSPSVSFKHGNRHVTMTVTCDNGVPSATST